MNVIAINSSPRTQGESRTERLLLHLVDGMQQAGANVEVINLREHDIKFCQGCYTCWTKTPGECRIKDDMSRELFHIWAQSDIVVYASPLYYRGVTALMQSFIERTLPSMLPYLVSHGDRTNHPVRTKHPDVVLLSVAGFPEMSEFDLLSDWARYNFNNDHSKLLAEIYRPGSQSLTQPFFRKKAGEIYNAMVQAGQELIQKRFVDEKTISIITQPLQEKEPWVKTANIFWQSCIDLKILPKKFEKEEMVPIPKSIDDMQTLLTMGMNIDNLDAENAVAQFQISGEQEGSFYLEINGKQVTAILGNASNPTFTVNSPFEIWRDIMIGKEDGAQMMMEGRYSIEGDSDCFIKLFA